MTLTPGTKLGPYEILSPLGAGGMGEVYKAKDARLDRFVAIKVLPEHLAKHAESLARFEREAKAVAALNHPNITGLFDLGREGEAVYAVMELLEGQALRTRLQEGPLSPRQATELAIQMAQGLAAAHGKGVVHRDLKPENLWLTHEGRLKILDFGLAKQLTTAGPGSNSFLPTEAFSGGHHTEKGMILGTLGYMSPEQVRGEAVDARADIFSFGVVLFEMLTGKRAFGRDTAADTMAAILKEDPPAFEEASRPLPPGLRNVVEHCLEKLPARRFQSAEDLAFALGNLAEGSGASLPPVRVSARKVPGWALGALAGLLLLAAFGAGRIGSAPAASHLRYFDLEAPSPITAGYITAIVLSPDGQRLAYASGKRLWVRALSETRPREVVGSEQALNFFWSVDGTALVFSKQGKVWRSTLGQEPPLAICDIPGSDHFTGGAWLKDGTLLLAAWRGDLYRVPATGGVAQKVLALDPSKEIDFHQMALLPDGESVLTVLHSASGEHDVVQLKGATRTVLLHDDHATFWVAALAPPGYLLYTRQEHEWTEPALWAAPYDPAHARLTGPAFLVEPGLNQFSVEPGGLLAYRRASTQTLEPVWVDESGKVLEAAGPAQLEARDPALSPDGRRVAVSANSARGRDIQVLDLGAHTWSPATDAKAGTEGPRWSPDGKALSFELLTQDSWFPSVALAPADGSAPPRKLVQGMLPIFSSDGRSLVYALDRSGEMDIMRVPQEGGAPAPVLATANKEIPLAISPDGHWLLYGSNESGRMGAYVLRYPEGGGKQALSFGPEATYLPVGLRTHQLSWTAKGRITFWDGKRMSALEVDTRSGFRVSGARTLFEDPGQGLDFSRGFDVDPRTGRILALRNTAGPTLDHRLIRVIENVGTLLAQRSGRR